ncbi:endonuclease domain-containing protein [Methylococcus sp. EFPC2]|uniref:endonuclease domain-containing protein n=1 Tax=Methylococcus sp. EFPC2 TaxID=2812648 RepID=UPI0019671B30|nr:endonuclease domain-containing protein [Methylococcus sp. EFPC2]QSA98946.1 endonuclease domain-containing protein [Methylococcus sp. EFPC2]
MSRGTRIDPVALSRARMLRKDMTDAERKLWRALRGQQIGGFRFRRQHVLGAYIVDFVCLEARLIIELDGSQHAERARYDDVRTAWLGKQGYRLIRFWNHEVLCSLDGVLTSITQALGMVQ